MCDKLVSIILPTYNGSRFIKDSIESIINQTYKNWELIIINDCSTDNTLNICKEYAKNDNRIKIFTNETNKKLPASLNIGFEKACGEYLTWTSDDNMYKENAINYMVEYLEKHLNVDFISSDFDYVDENNIFINTQMDRYPNRNLYILPRFNVVGACFMYRREIINKVGKYDESQFLCEDYDYWFRIALCCNMAFLNNVNLYKYRESKYNLSSNNVEKVKNKADKIRLKYVIYILSKLKLSKYQIFKYLYEVFDYKKDIEWENLIKQEFGFGFLYKKFKLRYLFERYIFSYSFNYKLDHKVLYFMGIQIKFKYKRS